MGLISKICDEMSAKSSVLVFKMMFSPPLPGFVKNHHYLKYLFVVRYVAEKWYGPFCAVLVTIGVVCGLGILSLLYFQGDL